MALDLLFQVFDRLILNRNEGEQLSQDKAMVLSHFSCQSRSDLFLTRLHPWTYPLGEPLWITFSLTERLENGSSRHSRDITEDSRSFHPSLFKNFMHPIDQAGAFPDQADPQPGQVSQVLLFLVGHETGVEEPMLKQTRNPFGILHIRFSPWHGFDMLRVGHYQFEEAL